MQKGIPLQSSIIEEMAKPQEAVGFLEEDDEFEEFEEG